MSILWMAVFFFNGQFVMMQTEPMPTDACHQQIPHFRKLAEQDNRVLKIEQIGCAAIPSQK